MVERGRWMKPKVQYIDRKYTLCNDNDIQDEYHIVLKCAYYNEVSRVYAMAIWIDLQKAFDKVWTDGLFLKLKKCRIGGNMYKWIKSYLHNRRARVTIDNAKRKKKFFSDMECHKEESCLQPSS